MRFIEAGSVLYHLLGSANESFRLLRGRTYVKLRTSRTTSPKSCKSGGAPPTHHLAFG